MNQKHHVSLPIAKQLVEAGIVIESESQWEVGGKLSGKQNVTLVLRNRPPSFVSADSAWSFYPAPIATEILEWFPRGYDFGFELIKLGEGYGAICKDYRVMPYKRIGFEKDDNASDALALLLIRLTKDGIL